MDSDKPSSTGRKYRFAPKSQAGRKPKAAATPKPEKAEDDDDAETQKLLQHFNERGKRQQQRRKVENKSPVQPTFIHGAKPSTTARASDVPQYGDLKQSSESDLMDLDDSSKQPTIPLPSTNEPSVSKESSGDDSGSDNEFIEPWDYSTYYPTTLPWRRPNSGDPVILDEAEFGEAATKLEYDENTINAASELGFLNPDETNENPRLLFLQFPKPLPVTKRSATAKGKEIESNSATLNQGGSTAPATGASQQRCNLEDLEAGYMGKLLVYRSGAVKLKLGDTLFDVSPGSDPACVQEVVAINTKEKDFCVIGDIAKRAVVTPDVNHILDSVIDLG